MSYLLPVLRGLAVLNFSFACFMVAPAVLSLSAADGRADDFAASILITLAVAAVLVVMSRGEGELSLDRRQGFLLTTLAWTLSPLFGAAPLMLAGLSLTDAYFEAVSAMTTTGATVMTGLDQTAPSILLWRSIMQWVGGIGIIVVGIIVMPFLRVGGMQLFQTESSDKSDKIVARSFDLALWIAGVYAGLTLIAMIAYRGFGMSWFDALNHAMTSIATGGFSTHDASFGYFNQPALQWVGSAAMLAGALPFVAFIRLVKGDARAFATDLQIRGLLVFLFIVIGTMTLIRSDGSDVELFDSLRAVTFNVVSVVTTTGYASEDYQSWGAFAIGIFFVLTFIGGCSGSTSGGVKVYRFQILARLAVAHLSSMVSPSSVHIVRYNLRRVDDPVAFAILAFLVVFLFSWFAITLMLALIGVDLVTALTSSATCLTNVGPGLGDVVGPAGNFLALPPEAKWILSAAMILGRLEFFTVFVLFTPAFWRR